LTLQTEGNKELQTAITVNWHPSDISGREIISPRADRLRQQKKQRHLPYYIETKSITNDVPPNSTSTINFKMRPKELYPHSI
jgi:hypothetical protein